MIIPLRRETLTNYRHQPNQWLYSYATPVDINWASADGERAQGPRAGSYVVHGRSVVELRAMLRRKFGRTTTFTEPWKATS